MGIFPDPPCEGIVCGTTSGPIPRPPAGTIFIFKVKIEICVHLPHTPAEIEQKLGEDNRSSYNTLYISTLFRFKQWATAVRTVADGIGQESGLDNAAT